MTPHKQFRRGWIRFTASVVSRNRRSYGKYRRFIGRFRPVRPVSVAVPANVGPKNYCKYRQISKKSLGIGRCRSGCRRSRLAPPKMSENIDKYRIKCQIKSIKSARVAQCRLVSVAVSVGVAQSTASVGRFVGPKNLGKYRVVCVVSRRPCLGQLRVSREKVSLEASMP